MKKDKCTEMITIRCSKREKDMIQRKAEKVNKSVSSYVLDSSIAGLERKRDRDRRVLLRKVEKQEKLNDIYRYIKRGEVTEKELYAVIETLIEEEKREWEC